MKCKIVCGIDRDFTLLPNINVYKDPYIITENPNVIIDFSLPKSITSILLIIGTILLSINNAINLKGLKEHGENLNCIGMGMTKAVEERMKSERLKTELITNVSHDIKTPLTSIINYVDLLKRENIDFIVLAGFLLKIPAEWVEAFQNRIVNIHPALLPKFGGKGMYGMRVHEAVVANGEKEPKETNYVEQIMIA